MLLIRVESQGCSVAESVTINAGGTGSTVEITVPVSQRLRGSNYPEDEHAASARLMLFTSTETVRAIR